MIALADSKVHVLAMADAAPHRTIRYGELRERTGAPHALNPVELSAGSDPLRLLLVSEAPRVTPVPGTELRRIESVFTTHVLDAHTLEHVASASDIIGRMNTAGTHMFGFHNNLIRIWSMQERRDIYQFHDPRVAIAYPHGIDGNSISGVDFDGLRRLVYTIDSGWGPGEVVVRDIAEDREEARFLSRNGHAVMDVDFHAGRIAIGGTECKLRLFSLNGRELAMAQNPPADRISCVRISPSGRHVAVGVQAHVHVFGVVSPVAP